MQVKFFGELFFLNINLIIIMICNHIRKYYTVLVQGLQTHNIQSKCFMISDTNRKCHQILMRASLVVTLRERLFLGFTVIYLQEMHDVSYLEQILMLK